MELYKETANNFVEYLIKHGYPEESIILEYGTKQTAIDIVVVADDMKTPIAAFEIKGKKNYGSMEKGIKQMKKAVELLPSPIPISLVFELDEYPFYQVVDISNNVYGNETPDIEELLKINRLKEPLSYQTINTSYKTKNILKKVEKSQIRMDFLALFCWSLIMPAGVILLILDALDIYSLSTERLIMLGAIVVIFILPFYSEISVKDIYMKRSDKIKTMLHIKKKK